MKLPKYRYSVSARSKAVGWTQWKFHSTLYLTIVLFGLVLALVKQQSTLEPKIVISSQPRLVSAQESTPLPTPSPEPTPGTKWEQFVKAAEKVSKIYNYPAKVVISQGHLESAWGNSHFCVERNNCLGIGAVDWAPEQAYKFENMEQSIVEYMRIIRKNFPTAWANRHNPDLMIQYIKYDPQTDLMYATDPDYVAKVRSMLEWSN